MADNVNSSLAVGDGPDFATKDIAGVHYPRNIITDPSGVDITPLTDAQLRAVAVPVSGMFWQATQPVSGPLTDAQLRATAVPISGTVTVNVISGFATEATLAARIPVNGQALMAASVPVTLASNQSALPVTLTSTTVTGTVAVTQSGAWSLSANQSVNVAQINGVAPLMGTGISGTGAQRVTLATDIALPAGTNIIGALSANQSVNVAQMNGVAVTMGSGVTGTGVQRVVLATDVALPTGANVIGALTANQSVNNAQIAGVATSTGNGVVGTGVQRVAIASDNTAFSVNATPPTLTKGTQGATGYSTQDLHNAGRAIVNAATAIAGVTAVTTEALLTLAVSRDCAATSNVTTIAVTSGKRLRVIGVTAGLISTGASVLSGRISLRMNPSGVAAATSPIICTLPIPSGAALAQAGGALTVMFPEAIEFSGTMQIGLSQVCSATTGTVWASILAYEY